MELPQCVTANIQCIYSKRAYSWYNAYIESFHALIKQEWLNRLKSVILLIHIDWYLNI